MLLSGFALWLVGTLSALPAEPPPHDWVEWLVPARPSDCGDRGTFETELAARLGRPPSAAAATLGIRVRADIDRLEDGPSTTWIGQIRVVGAHGQTQGVRRVEQSGASCRPLVDTLVLVTTLILQAPADRPLAPVPAAADLEVPNAQPPRARRPSAWQVIVAAGPATGLGALPAPYLFDKSWGELPSTGRRTPMRTGTTIAPRKAAMLIASVALLGLDCSRDLLVGSSQMSSLQPGLSGEGGTLGAAGCGSGFGGSRGAGGAAPGSPACASISTVPGHRNACGRTSGIAYSPDGQLVATATETPSPNIHIWRLSDGALLRELEGHGGEGSYGVAFSPDGTLLATAGNAPKTYTCASPDPTTAHPARVKLWDVATGALVREIPANVGPYADTAEFSHDGKRLVTGGGQGDVQIWNVADATLLATIGTGYTTYAAHFSPDDTRIVNAGSSGGVWSAADGSAIFPIAGFSEDMNDAAFSPDQTEIVATGQGGALHFLDASGAALQSVAAHTVPYISHVVWVDDDHLVSDDWGGNVKNWSRDTSGQFALSGTWSLGTQALGMAVSPDRGTLAVALADGFVFLSLAPASTTTSP